MFDLLVTVLEEDRLPTIPTLRNVVRKASDHRTRQSYGFKVGVPRLLGPATAPHLD